MKVFLIPLFIVFQDVVHSRGLNDLLYNYVSERFAELYHDVCFNEPLEMYKREQVEADVEQTQSSPHEICRLIDQRQQLVICFIALILEIVRH